MSTRQTTATTAVCQMGLPKLEAAAWKKGAGSALISWPEMKPAAVEHPAQDHRITDGDAQRAHQGQPAECAAQLFLSPSGKAVFIGPDGARSGQSADAELGGQAHPAEEKDEEQIGDEEGCAAILSQTVGEHPDVAQAHGELRRR